MKPSAFIWQEAKKLAKANPANVGMIDPDPNPENLLYGIMRYLDLQAAGQSEEKVTKKGKK